MRLPSGENCPSIINVHWSLSQVLMASETLAIGQSTFPNLRSQLKTADECARNGQMLSPMKFNCFWSSKGLVAFTKWWELVLCCIFQLAAATVLLEKGIGSLVCNREGCGLWTDTGTKLIHWLSKSSRGSNYISIIWRCNCGLACQRCEIQFIKNMWPCYRWYYLVNIHYR